MGKRKKSAGMENCANAEFAAVDFQGSTIADLREVYMQRWTMVAFSVAILQRDHVGCKDMVAELFKVTEDGGTFQRFVHDLRADQSYFAALIEDMKLAEVRLLAGAARFAVEDDAYDRKEAKR